MTKYPIIGYKSFYDDMAFARSDFGVGWSVPPGSSYTANPVADIFLVCRGICIGGDCRGAAF